MNVDISMLVGIAGCLVGVGGFFAGRDRRVASDAEWKGQVNAKLDMIVGMQTTISSLTHTVQEHGERITTVEQSTKSAHNRIDEIVKRDNL